jgi:hypothetical protein
MGARGFIDRDDLDLFAITDDVEAAVHEILNFYSNYHSSRYVGGRLVLRVRRPPEEEELDQLNVEFKDILVSGAIEVGEALPEEADEVPHLARVLLHFNRREHGRLRKLIDRLNALVADEASPPREASPHQLVPLALPEAARSAEEK